MHFYATSNLDVHCNIAATTTTWCGSHCTCGYTATQDKYIHKSLNLNAVIKNNLYCTPVVQQELCNISVCKRMQVNASDSRLTSTADVGIMSGGVS